MAAFVRWVKSWTGSSKSKVPEETNPTTHCDDFHPDHLQPNTSIPEEPGHSKCLADAVKEQSKLLEKEPIPVYKIDLKDERINVSGCKCFSFGEESHKRNRTIMVVGATGAGKSTLINGMINYILGVKWDDSYRFKLIDEGQSKSQAESQTSEVTAYKINHQEGFKIEHSLTIVDTPGFGDTRGIERDKMIVEQLRNLFSSKQGVSDIDAVCFVAQASLARLTPTQKYVFDSILSIFGKDVAENIRVLVTFADGQRPPVLEAINASGVPCPKNKDGLPVHFKFNNSAWFAHNKSSAAESRSEDDDGDEGFEEMFWNMGTRSMKKFLDALNQIKTKSLTLTQEVLRKREQLENSVENLQKQVKLGLAKLEEIRETSEKLKDHEAEISRNENFEFEVKVTKPFQEAISGTGVYLTNCQVCSFTCHYPCGIPNDADKKGCDAMDENGYCNRCREKAPDKCHWSVHFNQKYKWEYREVKVKRTVKELQEKYLKATDAKMPVQALIDRLREEYDLVQADVVELMKRCGECLNRLKEIALKPNPLSTPEYIDMLIEGEKSEARPGWNRRVESLMDMKKQAEYLAKVERGENPLQLSPTDFQCSNQGQTKKNGNQDKIDTSNANTDSSNNQHKNDTNTDISENQDKDSDTKQDDNKTKTDVDQSETDTDAIDTNQNADQNETDTDAIDANQNADQNETDTDAIDANQNADQNETDTDAIDANQNADQNKTDTDASDADQNADRNETDTDASDADQNADQNETDTDASDADQNADQNETDTDASQGKTEHSSILDQDEYLELIN